MSLINTRLQDFRAKTDLDKLETRASRWGAFDAFIQQTNSMDTFVTKELKDKALAASGSNLQVPVIDYDGGVSVTNTTIPLVITGTENTSQLVNVTFTDYYFGFLIHPAKHFNNEISIQKDFNVKLKKHVYELMNLLDNSALAALEANKTQILNDDLGGRYSLVGNTVVAPLLEQERVIGDIGILYAGNDFYDDVTLIANPSMESHVRNYLGEKAEFNSENKTYQYNDKIWHFTNRLNNGAGQKASSFCVQSGTLGFVQQFLPDCIQGNRTHKHIWDIEQLPIAGIPVGVFQYDDAVDGTALAGAATARLSATKAEAYGFHMSTAMMTAYNSDPANRASAIMKVAISAT